MYCYRLGWKLELEAAAREAWRARPGRLRVIHRATVIP